MKTNAKRLLMSLGLGVCCITAGQVMAQQQDSVSMNLDKVLEVALSDNPDIQVANRTIEIKKYAKKETITGLFPTVSASLSGTRGVIIPEISFAPGMTVKMGKEWTYNWQGAAVLPIIAPQLWESLKISQASVELAVEQARSSKVSTLASVKKAFYQLLMARDSYDVLNASYQLADENLTLARNMYNNGLQAEYDTLTAYSTKVALEPTLLQMKNTLKVAEMQLKVLMGVDVNEPIRFEGHLKDYEEKLFADLMILKNDNDLDNNSSLIQIDLQKKQLVLSEKLNKLGYIPTVALQFTVGNSFMMGDYMTTGSLTLALSWTIFDGGSKYMKTKQNKLNIENLEQQREYVKHQLELAINSSLVSIETAAEQTVSNKTSIYASERAYEISAKRYEVGSGTQLEVNASANSLQNARLQYVQSIYDFVSAQATLEETLGKVVTDK
ncbi:MAG: TolC family protein [Bacteroidales bacterium]|nr:TolC family protein [Candidatus Liminaster caballi]